MSRPSQTRQRFESRPRRHARVAGVVAAALVISWGGPAANAFWQTLSNNAGVAIADSIPAVAAPAASVSSGAAAVSWLQGTTAAGRPVAGYTVARYASATGGTRVAAGGGCAGTITTLTCTEASLPAGTWYYTVTPVLGAWAGVESARSGGATAADTTPPATPSVTAPAMIASSTAAASVLVSGNAEAGSSVTITVNDAGAAHTTSQTVVAESSGAWSATFNLVTFNDPTISYSAVAKDAAGNVSLVAGTATSSKDTTAPRVTAVSLSNGGAQFTPDAGDKVTLTFSEPLLPSSICSGWQDVPGSQTVNGTVTITGGNLLGFGTTDAGCPSVRFGSVAFNGTYGGNSTFNSSLTWNPGTSQLTVTLGSLISGTPASKSGNVTPTYTPAAGLTDKVGHQLPTTPFAGTNSRF